MQKSTSMVAVIIGAVAAAPASLAPEAAVPSQPNPIRPLCGFTAPDGTVYDFSGLENPAADYAIVSNAPNGNRYTYYYNFCKGTAARGSQTNTCTLGETALCQNDPKNPQWAYSLGSVNQATWSELQEDGETVGIKVKYLGGTGSRTSELEMRCNSDVETVVFEGVIQRPNDDRNFFTLKASSKLACRGNTPPGPPPPPAIKCTHTTAAGVEYDLTELQEQGPFDLIVTDNADPTLNYTHSIGICAESSPCPGNPLPTEGPVASCQTLDRPGEALQGSNGKLSTLKLDDLTGPFGIQGVQLTYVGARDRNCESAANPNGERRTSVEILCSATPIAPDPILKFLAEDPKCVYNFALESDRACPTPQAAATRTAIV